MEAEIQLGRSPSSRPVGFVGKLTGFNRRRLKQEMWAWNICPYFLQLLNFPKSHHHDAVAIACEVGEVVKPLPIVYQLRCIPRGNYQLYNGKHSEHKVWAPKKVKGWKLYEIVEAKGQIGYIGGRRIKGAFMLKDLVTGKPILEVTPRKLRRLARPTQGRMIHQEEERASSPA